MANEKVDERTEYQCAYSLHNDLIKSRFTVAGLYLAASAVVIGKVADLAVKDETGVICCICPVMIFLAIVCIVLDGRTKFLYRTIANRLAFLEKDLVPSNQQENKPGPQTPLFYFCFYQDEDLERITEPPSRNEDKSVSHSFAFDLLYWGSLSVWGVAFVPLVVCTFWPQWSDTVAIGGGLLVSFLMGFVVGQKWDWISSKLVNDKSRQVNPTTTGQSAE